VLGRFFIKVTLQDLKIQRKWDLVFVYGASEEEDKEMFLSELAAVCSNRKKSYVDWGDFNILRFSFEKNKGMRRNNAIHPTSLCSKHGSKDQLQQNAAYTHQHL
jgi:hypothetical protein